jgi:hypothetical protein
MDEATIVERLRAELGTPPPPVPPELWPRIVRRRRREPWRRLVSAGLAVGTVGLVVAVVLATLPGAGWRRELVAGPKPPATAAPASRADDPDLAAVRATLAGFTAGILANHPGKACPFLAGDARRYLGCDNVYEADIPPELSRSIDSAADAKIVSVADAGATAQIPYPAIPACRNPKGAGAPQVIRLRKLQAGWKITGLHLIGEHYSWWCPKPFRTLPSAPSAARDTANLFAVALFEADPAKACTWLTGQASAVAGCQARPRAWDGPVYDVSMWGRPISVDAAGPGAATATLPYFVPNGCSRAAARWAHDQSVRLRLDQDAGAWRVTRIDAPGPLGACPERQAAGR